MTAAEARAAYEAARARVAAARTELRAAERDEEAARVAHNEARNAADLLLPQVYIVYPPNWMRSTPRRNNAVIVKRTPKTVTVRIVGTDAERPYRMKRDKWRAVAKDDLSWLEGVPE